MRLFLARHGNTDWTENGRIQGHTDIPLNDLGRESAKRLAQELIPFQREIGLILSSDLQRASETATIINAVMEKPLFIDQRLREASFGTLDGMTKEAIKEAHGNVMDRSLVDWDFRPFGGEDKNTLLQRYLEAIEEYQLQLAPGLNFLIVGHGRSLSTLSRHFGHDHIFPQPASWISIEA